MTSSPSTPSVPSRVRRVAPALLLALVCLAACNQQSLPTFRSTMSGVYDLALFKDDLLFVTSADRDELRVMDLTVTPRDFVRAPNPLEPLSIPVVARPVGMVRDLHYDEKGQEVPGPYVYAHGAASPSISVVGADRSSLREVLRVDASQGGAMTGNVTALAAHGPDGGRSVSTLYYATSRGTSATLWSVDLPGLDTIDPNHPPKPRDLLDLPGAYISVLLVLPKLDTVVVATRQQGGTQGSTFILDTSTGTQTPLLFPGPVRMMVTNPRAAGGGLPEGSRVLGVLDEEACGSSGNLCIGILAVDTATGRISNDSTFHPMVPISFGQALIRGLTLQPGAFVATGDGSGGSAAYVLLGLGTTSAGEIFFFDAGSLRQIDQNTSAAGYSSISLRAPDDSVQSQFTAGTTGPLPGTVHASDGATRDETVRIINQGVITGLANLSVRFDPGGPHYPFPPGYDASLQAGDFIEVSSGSNPGCQAELSVSSVGQGELLTSTPLPPSCGAGTVFTVRAGGSLPYVVVGDISGFMGRTGPNQSFSSLLPAQYYYHPDGVDPSAPQLRFTLGPPDANFARDWRYAIVTVSNFLPLGFFIDNSFSSLAGYYLPGSIVHLPDQPIAFVAYPSANGLIEFNPPFISPNKFNASNIKSYP